MGKYSVNVAFVESQLNYLKKVRSIQDPDFRQWLKTEGRGVQEVAQRMVVALLQHGQKFTTKIKCQRLLGGTKSEITVAKVLYFLTQTRAVDVGNLSLEFLACGCWAEPIEVYYLRLLRTSDQSRMPVI